MLVPGVAALAALLAFGLAGTASAFHGGGVAHCDGCHSMHNVAGDPDLENPGSGTANDKLLKGSDPSSTCLNCHETASLTAANPTRYYVKTPNATALSPGGDFFWLTYTYTWTTTRGGTTTTHTSDPNNVAHNIIAGDKGLTIVDPNNPQAPGGTYDAANLGCDSCHDPHGQVNGGASGPIAVSGSYGEDPGSGIAGNYRILGDAAYGLAAAPIAVISETGPNGDNKYGEADDHHVAYGSNMSEWCESCHTTISDNTSKHPAGNGELLSQTAGGANTMAFNYNRYVETGDLGGDSTSSYLALVPFEIGASATTADLLTRSLSTEGPAGDSNVMCLTCHRAHASAFNNIMRWDAETELLIDSLPGPDQLTAAGLDTTAPYYGRVIGVAGDFGEYQRSLCNKCHVKD